jgi:hypothetical protein
MKISNWKVLTNLLLQNQHNVQIPPKKVPYRMTSPMRILMRMIIKNNTVKLMGMTIQKEKIWIHMVRLVKVSQTRVKVIVIVRMVAVKMMYLEVKKM